MPVTFNEIIPDVYPQFEAVPRSNFENKSALGIIAVGLAADWGKDGEVTEMYSEDLLSSNSLKKVGYTLNDEQILPYRIALTKAYKGLFYKLNAGGNKATKTIGSVIFTAKYTGVVGNRIGITIQSNKPTTGKTQLNILVDGVSKETRIIKTIDDFPKVVSDWVDITLVPGGTTIAEATNVKLENGTNGNIVTETTPGVKAYTTIGDLKFEALKEGTQGNSLGITIEEVTGVPTTYTLKVLDSGVEKEVFDGIEDIAGFLSKTSVYVSITNPSGSTISTATNKLLSGGADATESSYDKFFKAVRYANYSVICVMGANELVSEKVINYVNEMYDSKKYIQGVVYNKPSLDNKYIVSVHQGIECDSFTISEELFPIAIGSLRAGCPLGESLTDENLTKVFGAKKIINPIENKEDKENAIRNGEFCIHYINDGSIRVLKDINTFVSVDDSNPDFYTKNATIQTRNYILNEEQRLAHDGRIGKYVNSAEKRSLLAATFLEVFKDVEAQQAIAPYDPLTDMKVEATDDPDLVEVTQRYRMRGNIEYIVIKTYEDISVE